MATNHDANFALIESNYLQAAENYYDDMAATRTSKEVQKVEQNYQESESAWALALTEVLNRSNAQIEKTQVDLKKALKAVSDARKNHDAIAALIPKLQMASSIAGTLVRLAMV